MWPADIIGYFKTTTSRHILLLKSLTGQFIQVSDGFIEFKSTLVQVIYWSQAITWIYGDQGRWWQIASLGNIESTHQCIYASVNLFSTKQLSEQMLAIHLLEQTSEKLKSNYNNFVKENAVEMVAILD